MRKHIVVIDDDEANLEFLRLLLSDAGYEVTGCRSGASAVQCIRTTLPDAITLDARLETNEAGWDVLRQIKSDLQLKAIPVIVCTADHQSLAQHAPLLESTGAVGLPKPFDIDDLLSLLATFLCNTAA